MIFLFPLFPCLSLILMTHTYNSKIILITPAKKTAINNSYLSTFFPLFPCLSLILITPAKTAINKKPGCVVEYHPISIYARTPRYDVAASVGGINRFHLRRRWNKFTCCCLSLAMRPDPPPSVICPPPPSSWGWTRFLYYLHDKCSPQRVETRAK